MHKNLKGMLCISILIILGLFSVALQDTVTGFASQFPVKNISARQFRQFSQRNMVSCYDSDHSTRKDMKYGVQGNITWGNKQRNDRCQNDHWLIEETCLGSGGSDFGVGYDCRREGKVCREGACKYRTLILERDKIYDLLQGREVISDPDIGYSSQNFNRYHKDFVSSIFNHSNAGFIYMGQGELSNWRCPQFKLEQLGHDREGDYRYFNWWDISQDVSAIHLGGVYCLVNHDNTKLFRFKITEITPRSITIRYQEVGNTTVKTLRCIDGFCDEDVEVFCVGCTHDDAQFIQRTLEFQKVAKLCLDSYLNVSLRGPLRLMIWNPNSLLPCEASSGSWCENVGHGGNFVMVSGFQGIILPGETRVNSVDDIRLDLHENMHVYTRLLVSTQVPAWFNEGMSIQTGTRLNCSGYPQLSEGFRIGTNEYELLKEGRITLSDSQRNPHSIGSLFFYGLEVDYGCGMACAAKIWKRLSNGSSDHFRTITDHEIKEVVEAETGEDVTPLFELLEIPIS